MKLLEMASTDLDSRKTCDTVRGWLAAYGPDLKGIICAMTVKLSRESTRLWRKLTETM